MSTTYYVGIDLHKHSFTFETMDSEGVVLYKGRHSTEESSILEFRRHLDTKHELAIEPVPNVWWFLDYLRDRVGGIHVAHPYRVRLIAQSRIKTDRFDAHVLADLLRVGYLPECYQPPPEVIELRSLVTHRMRLVNDKIRIKNRIHALLTQHGYHSEISDLFGQKGRQYLDQLDFPPYTRLQVDEWMADLDYHESRLTSIESKLGEKGKMFSGYDSLCSIPGVGTVVATTILAIVGDIHRFTKVRSFARFTGLTPGHRDSGDRHQGQGITHEGPKLLRWALLQAEPHYRRSCRHAKRMYARVAARHSKQKAKVAVAHRLARIIYSVWKENRTYYAVA